MMFHLKLLLYLFLYTELNWYNNDKQQITLIWHIHPCYDIIKQINISMYDPTHKACLLSVNRKRYIF